jgi:serine/threonine protein kinase
MTAGVGTIIYTAPEVFKPISAKTNSSKTSYNRAADIYGLALILHELFGGGASFFPAPEGCDHRQHQWMIYNAKLERKAPQLQLKKLPVGIRNVIQAGVDANPTRRPRLEAFVAAIKTATS